ncbi:MAG: hypothetical protein ABI591_09995 [Kofleriaceae bacterium]
MRRAILVLLVACGGGHHSNPDAPPVVPDAAHEFLDASVDAAVLPVFRNPVTTTDGQLVTQALQLLGANVPGAQTHSCNNCHALTKQQLRYWRALGDTGMATCLTDLSVQSQQSALQMINCLRMTPDNPSSNFLTQKLGIYASAGRLPWFDYVFHMAYGADAQAQRATFIEMAAMPHGATVAALTQEQFDIVAEWFARGLPRLDETLAEDPAPTTCTQGISADVGTHVAAMATQGWRAVNKDNGMSMYDCGAQTDPKLCLADLPLANTTAYGNTWDVANEGHVRILKDLTYSSSYWTRSSPDGRFIGHGGGSGSQGTIWDLQRGVAVGIPAPYDPGFFPDNSGWMFQGSATPNTCTMAVLTGLTGAQSSVMMTEPGCTSLTEVGLYQHVGRALGGGDYFAINGMFSSDSGPYIIPSTPFGSNSAANFTPMILAGAGYVQQPDIQITQPFEGDDVLSQSTRLEITRVAGPADQLGYVLHQVNATFNNNTYSITAPEIARYCFNGGKPAFSYDERWIVFHRYTANNSDLYLMDLRVGVPIKITNMKAGQYALFPHFRSDGWIYADVRDTTAGGTEHLIASDAALLNE